MIRYAEPTLLPFRYAVSTNCISVVPEIIFAIPKINPGVLTGFNELDDVEPDIEVISDLKNVFLKQ